jgi:hypothetical protein
MRLLGGTGKAEARNYNIKLRGPTTGLRADTAITEDRFS